MYRRILTQDIPRLSLKNRRLISIALIAGAFVGMSLMTWGRWPDAMIDFGRELYVPWQLSQGKLLYADIAYFNGPLSPYLNALLMGVFGTSLITLVVANATILAIVLALLYRLLRMTAGRLASTVACMVAVLVFGMARLGPIGSYNFLCPYSHELTHGIAFSLAALVAIRRYSSRPRLSVVAATGCFLGLVMLTKAEVFLAAFVAVGTVVTLSIHKTTPRQQSWALLTLVASMAVVFLTAWSLLSLVMPPGVALRGVLGSWSGALRSDVRSLYFYQRTMGLVPLRWNLGQIGHWMKWYVLVAAIPTACAFVFRRQNSLQTLALAALFLIPFFLLPLTPGVLSTFSVIAPLQMVLLMLVCAWTIRLRQIRDSPRRNEAIMALALLVFSVVLLLKIFFRVRVYHYGFALAMPGTMMLVVALLDWLPRVAEYYGASPRPIRAAIGGTLTAVTFSYVLHTWHEVSKTSYRIGSGNDSFYTRPEGRFQSAMVDTITRYVRPDQTLAVVPEGVMVNYLTRRVNPTGHINFMPPELLLFGEEHILASFVRKPPDFVLFVNRIMNEYGVKGFGQDYGLVLHSYLTDHYRFVTAGRSETPALSFNQFVLARRDDSQPPISR